MFELCLFDLDDTLLRTADLDEVRRAGKNIDTPEYRKAVRKAYNARNSRIIYPPAYLVSLRKKFPGTKFGIFTRAPTAYAAVVDGEAYPDFLWDVAVTYERVQRTKPYGEGILTAMNKLGIADPEMVVLVGDGSMDIRAAYNAGASAVLDKSSWSRRYENDNWRALELMPDAIIDRPEQLEEVLTDINPFRLDLERRLSGGNERPRPPRFDRIGKFVPRTAGGDTTSYQVYTMGRYLSGDSSLDSRRSYHRLTHSIHANKDSVIFPDDWVNSAISFIKSRCSSLYDGEQMVVTVIPPRPGRIPRLAHFLSQLSSAVDQDAFFANISLVFDPDIFVYQDGVRSHHGDGLNAAERFENVRTHLKVKNDLFISDGEKVIVIDDVCTTGASLIYAGKLLEEAGSGEVFRLSIAMNVSKVI